MPTQLAPEVWQARKDAFLEAFPGYGTIRHTARAIGINERTVYEWLDEADPAYDPVFARAFPHAKEAACDEVLASLRNQALRGQYAWDTTAGIFIVKAQRPEFRDNVNVNVRQESVSLTIDFADLGPSDKAALLSRLADKLTTRQAPAELPPPAD